MSIGRPIRAAAAAALVAALVLTGHGPAAAEAAPAAALVKRGEYLATVGDCISCHTAPGGKAFAGGLPLSTSYGTLYSPNITPDRETGIGAWTDEEFYRAMHLGVGREGEDLYPVFPYPFFTKVTRDDVLAIKAYLFTRTPVHQVPPANDMDFPFDIRMSLGFWRELFFDAGTFTPNPRKSAQWNRGAYLVRGLGHCGACHTPRNFLSGRESDQALAGAEFDRWYALNITSDVQSGIGRFSVDELVTYFKKGEIENKYTVFGPMAEVIHNSLSKLSTDDLRAIAVYLKSTPPDDTAHTIAYERRAPWRKRGAHVYLENCAACHQAKGRGLPGSVPALADNPAVTAAAPDDVLKVVLGGIPATNGIMAMPSFGAKLDDRQIADVADYIRTAFGDHAAPDATAKMVKMWREHMPLPLAATEAARAFDCPEVGGLGTDSLFQSASGMMQGIGEELASGDMNAVPLSLRDLHKAFPSAGPTRIADAMVAAYCPLVAADDGLSHGEKVSRLNSFRDMVYRRASALLSPVNKAQAVVAKLHRASPATAGPTAPVACPAPSAVGQPALMKAASAEFAERAQDLRQGRFSPVIEAVDVLRQDHPDVSTAAFTDALFAAACPFITADPSLANADLHRRLSAFATDVAVADMARQD